MRILQVRFKNLNSLVGEWEIDFTHPAFAPEGLVAITGPTGAGKSTILDAVSLALYGRTPRLNRINKSVNEIISRRTAECFAEVTFETQAGKFRCHWSQRRARKKAAGELQPPKHEIADAGTGGILEAGVTGVAAKVEAVTGMDFDRFTRTMFLAQGSFAAFLLAAPDERAPVLEQITGTDIYSRISRRVHERCADERKKLFLLQERLEGVRLLDAEEEKMMRAALKEKMHEDKELAAQAARTSRELLHLEGIARLEDDVRRLALQRQELQKRVEQFAPEREKLAFAAKALELGGIYSGLMISRRMQADDRQSLAASQKQLPSEVQAVHLAEEEVKKAVSRLELQREENKKALPVIRKARELDLKIKEKELPLKESLKSMTEAESALQSLSLTHEREHREQTAKSKRLAFLCAEMERQACEGELVEQLAGIRERIEAAERLDSQVAAKNREKAGAASAFEMSSKESQSQAAILAGHQRERQELQSSFALKQQALAKLLGESTAAQWRERLFGLKELQSVTYGSGNALVAWRKSVRALAEQEKQKASFTVGLAELAGRIPREEKHHALLMEKLELLEERTELLRRIESLGEARSQLRDGEPCPLCGAREHPYAQGNVPVQDDERKRLLLARKELQACRDSLAEARAMKQTADLGLRQSEDALRELGRVVATEQRELMRYVGELEKNLALVRESAGEPVVASPVQVPDFSSASDDTLAEFASRLETLGKETEAACEAVADRLRKVEDLEKELTGLRAVLDKAAALETEVERKCSALVLKRDLAGQAFERLTTEAKTLGEQRESALQALRKEVEKYGGMRPGESLERLLSRLSGQREHWLARQREKTQLEQALAALAERLEQQSSRLRQEQELLEKQRIRHSELQRERELLALERQGLLEGRSPDSEEARLEALQETSAKAYEAADKKRTDARQRLDLLMGKITDLERGLEKRETDLRGQEASFAAALSEKGFSDEAAYISACLPEEERRTLADRAQALSDEDKAMQSLEQEKMAQLAKARESRAGSAPPDELRQSLEALVEKQKALQQEMGGISRKLADNDMAGKERKEHARAIHAQKKECGRWELLHDIIGSADGKKYRNYAQGLTFELLVSHANRQLKKMTDRYLLVRDVSRPLELNVVDNYQAGEIRTTKNLSGGESFVVSLALALGLSHMAGSNVRVDSLFLDEGFGSLDEEALETALETLGGLRQEGKLIVLISHVQALKERIHAQIRVQPLSGGRSRICGPGCVSESTELLDCP